MEVTLADEPHPYMAIEYKYAAAADSFAGYPEKYLISYKSREGLTPLAEIELTSVLLATQQLSAAFFNHSRFPNLITYTNVYSNSDIYATDAKTKQPIQINSLLKSGGFTNSHSRTGIYLCLVFVTLIPAAALLRRSVQKNKE